MTIETLDDTRSFYDSGEFAEVVYIGAGVEILGIFDSNFDDTLEAIRKYDNLFVMTRSDKGSVIVHRGEQHVQEATRVEKVIDTTGAGDAYCAGFLYGWVHDRTLAECARAGTLCATAVIQQVGARIEKGVLD